MTSDDPAEDGDRPSTPSDGAHTVTDGDGSRTVTEGDGSRTVTEGDGARVAEGSSASDESSTESTVLEGSIADATAADDSTVDGADASVPDASVPDASVPDSAGVDDGPELSYDLDTYRRLLGRLIAADYDFVGFHGPLESGEVALRHDVDLSVERAVQMARVEAQLGVQSTYCFLVTAPVYDLLTPENRRRLEAIVDAGHDVGLHFDSHRYWDEEPEPSAVVDRVDAERESLARIADAAVDAVSFHVPPSWALGRTFVGFESTYAPRYFEDVTYVSDSSQKWRSERPFPGELPDSIQLLVHPGLWHERHRPMAEIVAERREHCDRRIEEYVAPLGE